MNIRLKYIAKMNIRQTDEYNMNRLTEKLRNIGHQMQDEY